MSRRSGFNTRSGDSITLSRSKDNLRGIVGQPVSNLTRRAPEVIGGMELMTPTSVTVTGTGSSATINANGSVTFTSAATLSLDNVFGPRYDNYMISLRFTVGSGNLTANFRLRALGADASGANYTLQSLIGDGFSISAARSTSQTVGAIANAYATQRAGSLACLFGPYLAQPTAVRYNGAGDYLSASIVDYAVTHSLSNAYDGITLSVPSSNMTGLISVYGLVGRDA